jgi:hypothetical protein
VIEAKVAPEVNEYTWIGVSRSKVSESDALDCALPLQVEQLDVPVLTDAEALFVSWM